MAYVKIVYQNSPSTATPLNAENLNHMDDQIALNDQRLTEIETSYVKSFNGRKGEVTPQANDYNMSQITPTNGATVGQIPIVRNDGTTEEPNLTFHMEDVPSSGHVIKDQSGTSLAQEDALQFSDSFLTDDSANGRTIVENVKEVASADYSSETEDGMYLIPDGEGAVIEPASDDKVEVTGDGSKNIRTLLNELYAKIDRTKLVENTSWIDFGDSVYSLRVITSNALYFERSFGVLGEMYHDTLLLSSSESDHIGWVINTTGNTRTQYATTEIPTDGKVIPLYYGNKKATVDLQTTANRCWMGDGKTVESEINGEIIDLGQYLNTEAFINDHPNLFKAVRMGSMIVMNICGVIARADGSGQTMLTLPANFFSGYASATVFTDASSSPILMAGVFTNGSGLACHVPSGVAGKKLWGQIVLRAGSYFD